ncbi:hypothetical protein RHSIM_Rhsim09G0172600 [Rhododendron simsii]|uniref:Exostosin GT47 domain-containing protein n=1 Tax=Rhododendron simsii TaxID=118357 RepID=A0A834GDE3_RHOSS|nr:hypothetical protein RHSIM_Rhsim09G0172600 [Rhododendron simsii]
MNRILRQIIIVLVFRVSWRKLLFVGSIITFAGVVVQIYTLPYPLTIWILSPPETRLLYQSLNSNMRLSEKNSLARFEQYETHLVDPVISTNTSHELNQSVPIMEEGTKVSRQRDRIARRRRRNMKPKIIASPPPAPRRPVPHRLLRYLRSLTTDEALVYAKKKIGNISSVIDDPDPDLYAPLFRNVSIFQRYMSLALIWVNGWSYELMELILKVYIYQDGERPIFHEPNLQGIYSSEGWFMKLMEENRQFVTRDPEKAHLFYLPYSARQLQMALYGPYTLTKHEELTKNTIKALCNADVSEGIFAAEKDVSLPETTIRNPKRPLRGLGGKRVSQRPILAFFAGNMHGRVRPTLLKVWGDKDEDMRIYGPLPNRVSRNMSYVEHMKSSKYCICPMGYEVNSPRIVEAIYYECVPVIIADNFVPPLHEVLDWSAFSVIVDEKDIPKLKEVLLAIPLRRYQKMQINVKMLQKHFHWNSRPIRYDMFHMILHSIWHARLNQIHITQSS